MSTLKITERRAIARGIDGRKIGTVISSATKREVYMLDGAEITRERASDIAIEWWREYIPGVAFVRALVFRDCGTQETPSVSRHGKLWREYREIA